jgi:hypothetical protein
MPEELIRPAKKYWFGHSFDPDPVKLPEALVFYIDFVYALPPEESIPTVEMSLKSSPRDEFVKTHPDWNTWETTSNGLIYKKPFPK